MKDTFLYEGSWQFFALPYSTRPTWMSFRVDSVLSAIYCSGEGPLTPAQPTNNESNNADAAVFTVIYSLHVVLTDEQSRCELLMEASA